MSSSVWHAVLKIRPRHSFSAVQQTRNVIHRKRARKTFGRFALVVILVSLLTHHSGLPTNQLLKQHGRAAFNNGRCLLILTRVHRCQGMHRWSESPGKSASVQWKRASLTASSQHLDESTDTAPTVTKPSPGKMFKTNDVHKTRNLARSLDPWLSVQSSEGHDAPATCTQHQTPCHRN